MRMSKSSSGIGAPRGRRGFVQTGALLGARIRGAGSKRGFSETRLLTQWPEICGPDLAGMTRPVKISYARDGFGATLTVACDGAHAPEVQMQTDVIRQRVNACYGYNAISRVRIQQQDAAGFAEGRAAFAPASSARSGAEPDTGSDPVPPPEYVADVGDPNLRAALSRLGRNLISRQRDSLSQED